MKKSIKGLLITGAALMVLVPLQAIANNSNQDLGEPDFSLKVGQSQSLTAVAEFMTEDIDTDDYKIKWDVNDEGDDYVSINSRGVVKGVAAGKAEISATITGEKNIRATAVVEVVSTVEDLKVEQQEITVKVGESAPLNYEVLPSDAYLKDVKFKSGDTQVAKVTSSGEVIGVQEGTTEIVINPVDAGIDPIENPIKKVVKVNVVSTVTGVNITNGNETIVLDEEQEFKLEYQVLPANAYLKDVKFKAADSKIASVNSRGIIKGKTDGETEITVTTVDGGYIDKVLVKVNGDPNSKLVVDSITVIPDEVKDDKKYINIFVGEDRKVEFTNTPKEVRLSGRDVGFLIEDGNVLEVNRSGIITGKADGITKLTVQAAEGVYDVVYVKVTSTVKSIEADAEWTIKVGEEAEPPVQALPITAFNRDIIMFHDSKGIIKLNKGDRTITGLAPGTVEVLFKTVDGGFEHKMTIHVEGMVQSFDIPFETLELGLDTYTIEPIINPTDAFQKEIKYEILGDPIVSISNKTNVITPKAEGETTVRATTVDGGFVDEFTVIVDFDVQELKIYDENDNLIGSSDPNAVPEEKEDEKEKEEPKEDDDELSFVRKLIIEKLLERTDHPIIKQVLNNMLSK